MTKPQQDEALNHFNAHSEEWGRKAESVDPRVVNIIQQRNDYVLETLAARSQTRGFLDVGCGTGDLVRAAAGRGIPSLGIDFAEGMIKLAREKAAKEQLQEMMEMLETYIKLAVDVERKILAGGGAMHADCEAV